MPKLYFRITTSITFKCESSIRTYSKSPSTSECQIQNKEHQLYDVFLILPSMNSDVLGNPFFKKYRDKTWIKNLLKLPDMTYYLNEIKTPRQGRKKVSETKYPLCLLHKIVIRLSNKKFLCKNRCSKETGRSYRNCDSRRRI